MNDDQPRSKITIEDLLRVKRAERPPAEFWVRFEQELRAKQLAAIVEKRPWWRAVPHAFAGMARLHLPLGATAVLAITIFGIREYRRPSPGRQAADAAVASAMTPVANVESVPAASGPVEIASAMGSMGAEPAVAKPVVASNVRPGEISQVISMLGTDAQASELQSDSRPSARFIAANLAMVQAPESDLLAPLSGALGFETRVLPARTGLSEPMANMSTPKDKKLARYTTTALPAGYAFEAAASRPAEKVRSRVSDRQLIDDGSSRFGVDNGGLFFKL
jgi:hypothetical protein